MSPALGLALLALLLSACGGGSGNCNPSDGIRRDSFRRDSFRLGAPPAQMSPPQALTNGRLRTYALLVASCLSGFLTTGCDGSMAPETRSRLEQRLGCPGVTSETGGIVLNSAACGVSVLLNPTGIRIGSGLAPTLRREVRDARAAACVDGSCFGRTTSDPMYPAIEGRGSAVGIGPDGKPVVYDTRTGVCKNCGTGYSVTVGDDGSVYSRRGPNYVHPDLAPARRMTTWTVADPAAQRESRFRAAEHFNMTVERYEDVMARRRNGN